MSERQVYDDEIDLREYIWVVVKQWKIVVIITIAVTIIAFLLSIKQKPAYLARTTVLLRSGGSSSISQYAGLAGMLGINMNSGGGNLGDLMELMKSKAVASKVLDDLNLTQRIKGWDDPKIKRQSLVGAVAGMLKPTKATGNIVEVKVEADDPQLAADVADGYVSAIGYYWNELNHTEAQKKLGYIKSELPKVELELKAVESKLKLAPQASTGISVSGQGALQRDFDIYSSVYTMLRKELESAKLETSKEIPPFSVVDKAEKPSSQSKPNTKIDVIIGLVLGAFSGVFLAFFREYWEKSGRRK